MMNDRVNSIQDYSLEVAGPSKAPENSPALSWALLLEAQSI